MARFSLFAITALAQSALGFCGTVIFPKDNLRTRFRTEPLVFNLPWDPPLLLNGKYPTTSDPTDYFLNSAHSTSGPSWVDAVYPMQWELEFQGGLWTAHCRSWWWMSFLASFLYLIGLWVGTASMKDRKAYELKMSLALWNLFLAVFSFIGAARTVPHLLALQGIYGFEYTVCRAALPMYGNGAPGFWVTAFIFSKYFELIDTVFLVLRKRNVAFLHWYHHCSVLLYCWHAFVWEMPTGIYFVAMNYSVHAIMYFYYFLAATCKRPPKWALLVTILQLVQMAIGIVITLSHLLILIYETAPNCDGHIPNLSAALAMYASYFMLFAQFLGNRYCVRRGQNGDAGRGATVKKLE